MTTNSRGKVHFVLGGLALVLATVISRWALAEEKPVEEKPVEPVTIKKVVSAKLEVAKDALTVTAVGEVPTGGFTKPSLTRVTYIKQPDDGIQDYTLRAVPPTGVAAQVISQVTASDKWPTLPKWVKGVRIHGAGDGVLVKMLGGKG